MVMTSRCSVISRMVLVLGTSTSMPDCRIGAVIMKMISRTSTTSTNGTMLISESEVCVCLESDGIGTLFSWALQLPFSIEGFLDLRGDFESECVKTLRQIANVLQKLIIKDNRWDGGEKACGGGDQRFSNARRYGAQAGGASAPQTCEGVDNAPDRAEQTDERRNRASGGQPGHAFLDPANFFSGGQLHGDGNRRKALEFGSGGARRDLALQFPVAPGINRSERRTGRG